MRAVKLGDLGVGQQRQTVVCRGIDEGAPGRGGREYGELRADPDRGEQRARVAEPASEECALRVVIRLEEQEPGAGVVESRQRYVVARVHHRRVAVRVEDAASRRAVARLQVNR